MEQGLTIFDSIKQQLPNQEAFWSARELQKILGYGSWDKFENVIERAKKSFSASKISKKHNINDHFSQVVKMVSTGSGTKRGIPDYHLSRYACYLVAQNGDPRKEAIAYAQSYFNIQTFRQEKSDAESKDFQRLERRKEFSESDKKLSADIMEAGVSPQGMARIKASGNKVFFGGKTSKDMQKKLGTGSRPWADKASNVVLAGKTFANELTSAGIRYNGISGAPNIEKANNSNNKAVRDTIRNQSGLYPEDFPPEEDTKKIERRINKNKKLLK